MSPPGPSGRSPFPFQPLLGDHTRSSREARSSGGPSNPNVIADGRGGGATVSQPPPVREPNPPPNQVQIKEHQAPAPPVSEESTSPPQNPLGTSILSWQSRGEHHSLSDFSRVNTTSTSQQTRTESSSTPPPATKTSEDRSSLKQVVLRMALSSVSQPINNQGAFGVNANTPESIQRFQLPNFISQTGLSPTLSSVGLERSVSQGKSPSVSSQEISAQISQIAKLFSSSGVSPQSIVTSLKALLQPQNSQALLSLAQLFSASLAKFIEEGPEANKKLLQYLARISTSANPLSSPSGRAVELPIVLKNLLQGITTLLGILPPQTFSQIPPAFFTLFMGAFFIKGLQMNLGPIHSALIDELGALFSRANRRLEKKEKKQLWRIDRVSRKDESLLAEAYHEDEDQRSPDTIDSFPEYDQKHEVTSFLLH